MTIIELKKREDIAAHVKLNGIYNQFNDLLIELRKREFSEKTIACINEQVETINASELAGNELKKLIKQQQTNLLKQVEKEHKIVVKNHYRNLWMLLGFTLFGLPIGTIFGTLMGNTGLLGIGLPIGMAIGLFVGSSMDKKALSENRQLNIEMKY